MTRPIELWYWPTPNGWKISIALEEMGLPYETRYVNIGAGEQFTPQFQAISPNGRMPAIVDPDGPDGLPLSIFESGAILQYLGAKSGRVAGDRLGYSQVVNPIYLARKGTFPWSHALPSAARHFAMNALRSLAPEPHVDRFGRLRGNLRALGDLLRGRAHPTRILDF